MIARLPDPRQRPARSTTCRSSSGADDTFAPNDGTLVAACLLLLVGAFAKSAQLPLHTWLPDAMEGPTPVSALIHAATMVTAGVYLIARMHPLFELAPDRGGRRRDHRHAPRCCSRARSRSSVTDLKRVIAYSTISQIGYMVLGVSVGRLRRRAVPPDDARLLQGAAVHGRRLGDRRDGGHPGHGPDGRLPARDAVHVRDVHDRRARAGGLPAASSGFFSKDEILAFTLNRGGGYAVLGVLGYVGALPHRVLRVPDGVPRLLRRRRCPRRASSRAATWRTASPMNPMTGEPEDTDVGFPGPEHHIAERAWPMKAAMGAARAARDRRRLRRDPGRRPT